MGAPVHRKDVVGGMNARDKRMLKSAMENIWITKLVRYDPKLFKFMQIHEYEEDQALSLVKQSKCVLSLIHNRDTKNNK